MAVVSFGLPSRYDNIRVTIFTNRNIIDGIKNIIDDKLQGVSIHIATYNNVAMQSSYLVYKCTVIIACKHGR